jgi:hypothetical protein
VGLPLDDPLHLRPGPRSLEPPGPLDRWLRGLERGAADGVGAGAVVAMCYQKEIFYPTRPCEGGVGVAGRVCGAP